MSDKAYAPKCSKCPHPPPGIHKARLVCHLHPKPIGNLEFELTSDEDGFECQFVDKSDIPCEATVGYDEENDSWRWEIEGKPAEVQPWW